MSEIIDPKKYEIMGKNLLKKEAGSSFLLVINRKSRIVMSDGKKIVEKVNKIRKQEGAVRVTLKTNAPVCSKTITFLKENNIEITEG